MTPEAINGRTSHIRWNVLALITVVSFIAYVLRTNMSVAGERMIGDLGLSQVQLGIVLAAFAWGYAIFQFPGGLLGERLGGRRAMTLLIVSWGVLNMMIGLVPGAKAASPLILITLLGLLRFLMGVAQAPLYPVTSGETMARWFPVSAWALPNALANAGLTLGAAATGPLIAQLTETLGWRASFVVTGPVAFPLAALWWWYVRDSPAEHRSVAPSELRLIDEGRAAFEQGEKEKGAWTLLFRSRDLALLTASYFCANYVFYFFFNWLFIYLVDVRKFAALKGGTFAAIPWVIGMLGAISGGIVCDWLSKRYGITWGCRLVSIVGLGLAGVFILAAATATSPYVAVAYLSLCLAGQQFTDSAAWNAAMRLGGRRAAAACGVMNTAGNVVGGIGALLVPVIARDFGWPAALISGAAFAVVGAVLWFWIRLDRPLDAVA